MPGAALSNNSTGNSKATATALRIVARHLKHLGIPHNRLLVLSTSNHVTLQVSNTIVARVSISNRRMLARTRREIDVSRFLAEQNAPVIRPTSQFNPGPYQLEKCLLSYWTFIERSHKANKSRRPCLESLKQCHRALRNFSAPLPHFHEEIERCLSSLRRGRAKRFLPKDDRLFLIGIHDHLWRTLQPLRFSEQALHGDAHSGNTIETSEGLLWGDFESSCRGPIEWDLASLPDSPAIRRGADRDLLCLLRDLRSWCVAVWCWASFDAAEEKRDAARFHLGRLRKKFSLQ